MKFNFQFNNLVGSVYRRGNVVFGPDGHTLFSPVGNRISVFDLRSHTSSTLPFEGRKDYVRLAISPDGVTLLAVDDDGTVSLISLISRSVLHKMRTDRVVADVAFSPDGRSFAIAKENNVFVYRAPGTRTREYSPFVMERVLKGAFDDTTCLAWSDCSRILAVGSRDMTTRLYALRKFENFSTYCLGGHTEPLVAVFFEKKSLLCYTLSRNGHLAVWEPSIETDELKMTAKSIVKKTKKKKKGGSGEEEEEEDEILEEEEGENVPSVTAENESNSKSSDKLFFKRAARHFLKDKLPDDSKRADLTAADYSPAMRILVTGFSNGVFFIHEMPDCNMIHSLSISEQGISAISINASGDWIAFGCIGLGQLLVWEWQSETFVLKQQGHFNNMVSLAYSPDGQHIVTGGEDGKVKVWSTASGFSFVTFSEHAAGVTGVTFTPNGKVVLAAALDGTVRAFDLTRYRNFRTLTSPRPAQFSCVAVDSSGELVAAGGIDVYEVYLWSLKTGRLLEVISGHQGPVSALCFSPSPSSSALVTASWDKTLRAWDALAVGSSHEVVQLLSDATAVAYRPDGNEIAVATLNGHISFFDARTMSQKGVIEGRNDLGSGRSDTDLITAKKSLEGKCFMTLCYSADGSCILAGGKSKNICIYHVGERLLVKKFELSQNRSFDAMDEVISKKKMSEFGNLALVEDRDDPLGSQAIKISGTKRGDLSSRALRPEVNVAQLHFAPTGRDFAAATTEGLLIYSLDTKMLFDPFELDEKITPEQIRKNIKTGNFGEALLMALRLNENDLTREAIEHVPHQQIDLIVTDMPERYVTSLLKFVGGEIDSSRHLHFYALWCHCVLLRHSQWLRQKSNDMMPVLNLLHKNLVRRSKEMGTIYESNIHMMRFILTLSKLKQAALEESANNDHSEDSEGEDEDEGEQEEEEEDMEQ